MTNFGVYYSDNGWSQAYDMDNTSSSSYKTDAQMRALAQSNPLHHIWTGYKEFTYDPVAKGLISKTNNIASCSVDSQIGTTWATSSSGGTSGSWYVNKAVRAYLNPSSEGTLYRIRLAPLYSGDWWGEITITYYIYVSTASTDFTVSVTTGPHGYVSPTSVTVPQGTSYTATSLGGRMNFSNGTYIEAHPDLGYETIWSPSSGIISGNTTLSATFEKAYNVNFTAASNGSVSTSIIRVFEGTTYSANGPRLNFSDGQSVYASANTNYQFSSWSSSSGTITDNTTITANFTGVSITINFNGNGGTPSYNSGTYTYGSTYGSLPTATRSGYTFDGWYTEATGGTRINTYSTVEFTSTTPLYAHWSQNSYIVYINAGSHGSVSSSSLTVSYGTTYSASGDTLTFSDGQIVTATANTNYVVKSWSPSSGTIAGTTTISVSFQGKSIRLWASTWSGQSSYGSVYIHNNTTGETSTQSYAVQELYVRYGNSVSFVATPNTGYNFESWNHLATVYSYDPTYTLTATEDLDLSARFLQNATYTVTLQSQVGGTATATDGTQTITATSGGSAVTMTVVSGTSVTFTATPANQMVFERWESNSGLRYDQNPVSQAIAKNTEVTAVWNYPPVTVTFDAGMNGGTITGTSSTYTTMELQYGDSFFGILPGATKQGVSFVGWFTEPTGGTQIYNSDRFYGTTDTTYYAQFSEVYTLSIYTEHGTVTITDGEQTQTFTTEGVFTTTLQTVTLTASNPDAGYEFSGWTYTDTTTLEVHTSFLNPCTITFDSDLIINGIFNAVPTTALAYFSVGSLQHGTLDDGEVVATSIQKTVDLGEIVVIEGATITIGDVSVTAVPENNYTFDHWAGVSNNQTITGNVYPAAYFKKVGGSDDPPDPDEYIETVGDVSGGSTTGRRCYLAYYKTNSSTPTAVLELPNVQGIEETDTAQITEISSVIYGYDDNFVMDIGTIQKYNITFTRVQPMTGLDDSSDNLNYQDSWSNGHWFKMFKKFTERWQNLNYGVVNNVAVRTGGYRFHFEPGTEAKRAGVSYSDLYPVLDKTVFILGTASMQISPNNLQHIKVTLPVTVGSMVRQVVTTPGHEVEYKVHTNGVNKTNAVNYPLDLPFPVIAPPKEWFLEGALGLMNFRYWISNVLVDNNSTWYPGQVVNDTSNSISTMTSYWEEPILAVMVTYNMTTDGTFVWDSNNPLQNHSLSEISSATSVRAWAVGGGGAGGSRSGTPYSNRSSGGGGSGGFDSIGVGFAYADLASITFTVGLGGRIGSGVSGGVNGGTTSVLLNYSTYDSEVISVAGGRYPIINSSTSYSSDGGNGGSPGGTAGSSGIDGIGGAGASVPGLENGLQLGNFILTSMGGAGGAIRSDGGDGAGYGAGGGGGGAPLTDPYTSGGAGSPGVIILAFYE